MISSDQWARVISGLEKGPSAQCRVPLCKPILELNSWESVDVKNGKTLKDWTRERKVRNSGLKKGPSAQCRVPLCKPVLESNYWESVDVKNGKTLKDWTRVTKMVVPFTEWRGNPIDRPLGDIPGRVPPINLILVPPIVYTLYTPYYNCFS